MARRPSGRFASRPVITQQQLATLANRWEPVASTSAPAYRMATCVKCARKMTFMWHLWLREGGFKKEVHLCKKCARHYQ